MPKCRVLKRIDGQWCLLEQLIFTTIRECHTGEKALGFKVNGSKAWSVGIKRNKDYIFIGGKTGLLHAEALTIQIPQSSKYFQQ